MCEYVCICFLSLFLARCKLSSVSCKTLPTPKRHHPPPVRRVRRGKHENSIQFFICFSEFAIFIANIVYGGWCSPLRLHVLFPTPSQTNASLRRKGMYLFFLSLPSLSRTALLGVRWVLCRFFFASIFFFFPFDYACVRIRSYGSVHACVCGKGIHFPEKNPTTASHTYVPRAAYVKGECVVVRWKKDTPPYKPALIRVLSSAKEEKENTQRKKHKVWKRTKKRRKKVNANVQKTGHKGHECCVRLMYGCKDHPRGYFPQRVYGKQEGWGG